MGEARRRDKRPAGDPLDFLTELQAMREMARPEASVPCGACRACCHYGNVPVRDGEGDGLDTEIRDGARVLRQRDDGACVHLTDAGCGVYERRPFACRTYDCRIYALVGIRDQARGHLAPTWVFNPRDSQARAFLAAAQMAGAAVFDALQDAGLSCTAHEVTVATLNAPEFRSIYEMMLDKV